MITAVVDTHVVNWYFTRIKPLSAQAVQHIETSFQNGNQIGVSTMSLIELVYLIEKGRVDARVLPVLTNELDNPQGIFTEVPVDIRLLQVFRQIVHADIPEMFDRVIAATALMLNVPLITADHKIRAANVPTIW